MAVRLAHLVLLLAAVTRAEYRRTPAAARQPEAALTTPEFPRLALISEYPSPQHAPSSKEDGTSTESAEVVVVNGSRRDRSTPAFLRPPSRSRAARMRKKDGVKIATLPKATSMSSHRLMNDILVIPSPSGTKLYVLLLISIHEAAERQEDKGYECGRVNLDGFVKMTAFANALKEANASPLLSSLSLGAVVVDTCASDLRTIADLYELLAGTNIQKTDLVAVIRDDDSHLPNVDQFIEQLGIPVIHSFPERNPPPIIPPAHEPVVPVSTVLPMTGGPLINGLLQFIRNTNSTCFSVLYDTAHKPVASSLRLLADRLDLCVEERIQIDEDDNTADLSVRRLLLSEARAVLVLLDKPQWLQLLRALREELVIAGRFVLLAPRQSAWLSSRAYKVAWPYFDQSLFTARRLIDEEEEELRTARLEFLSTQIPELPFQKRWIRHFWATAYECHVPGEPVLAGDQQFSRTCTSRDHIDFLEVSPSSDILPIERAVEALATALRKLVDSTCPGALMHSIRDCTNQPGPSLSACLHSLDFVHSLAHPSSSNASSFDSRVSLERAELHHGEMLFEKLAVFDDSSSSFSEIRPLSILERNGSETAWSSACPHCPCSTLRLARRRSVTPAPSGLSSVLRRPSFFALIFASAMITMMCLLGIYHHLLSMDAFRVCGMYSYSGLACLSFLSPIFILPSSPFTCSLRRLGLSTCISAVYGPVFVEAVFLTVRRFSPSSSTLFWMSTTIVTLQAVIVGEWSFFESSSVITFVHGDPGAWRCVPGDTSRLLASSLIPGTLLIVAFLLALCRARWLRPVTLLLTLQFITFLLVGFLVLPELSFDNRDLSISAGLLSFVVSFLLLSLCRGRLTTSSLVGEEDRGRTLPTTINAATWNAEDERRFNEAVCAAAGDTGSVDKFSSAKLNSGHVFFINQDTGALTSQPVRCAASPIYRQADIRIADRTANTPMFRPCSDTLRTAPQIPLPKQRRRPSNMSDASGAAPSEATAFGEPDRGSMIFESERF